MWFWIGMLAALVASFVGWLKVQQTGNYESKWGAIMIWAVPVYVLIVCLIDMVLNLAR